MTGVCLRNNQVFWTSTIMVARAAAVALALSAPAIASPDKDEGSATGDSEKIEITGRIPPQCSFTEVPKDAQLGTPTPNAEIDIGRLGFTCNMAALSTVKLSVRSANGALKRDGGTETIAYEAWWKIGAFTGFTNVAEWNPTRFSFTEPSAANGVQKSASLVVKVTGPTANLTAGDYTDTLTFDVSP